MLRRNLIIGLTIGVAAILCATMFMMAASEDLRVVSAAMKGDRDAVRNLVKAAADVNAAQGDGTTALHWAALKGDTEMTQVLLYAGANVHAKTRIGGYSPLFMASKTGAAPVVDLLLKAGADANLKSSDGLTPLMMAAISGNEETVNLLLDHGADVNAKETEHGQTPAIFAAAFDRAGVLQELAKHGADLNAATDVQEPPQRPNFAPNGQGRGQGQGQGQQAAAAGQAGQGQRGQRGQQNAAAAGQAQQRGQQRGQRNAAPAPAGQQPQQQAQQNQQQNQQQVQAVTQAPDGGRTKSPRGGLTPLMYAARDGRMNALTVLIENGVDLNARSGDKSTALLIASINGHFDAAKYLVEKGADVNIPSIDDATPLYGVLHVQWSRESETPQPSIKREKTSYLDLMELMLDHGADPNAQLSRTLWYTSYGVAYESASDIGTTPFWKCASVGDIDGMKLLLTRGANPDVTNKDGVTPLLIASGAGTHGNDDIEAPPGRLAAVKFLVEQLDADVNASDNGNTVRDFDAMQGQQQPQPPAQQQQIQPAGGRRLGGYTALHNAAARGDNEMILYLVSKGAKVDAVTKTGVTVVDMANGPRQRIQPYASTVALLEMLGASNNHKCVSC
jgi:ankyrin repeat protein